MRTIGIHRRFILISSGSVCEANKRFVTYRRLKPDYSVAFTQYLSLNWTSEFEPLYTVTELKYNGVPPPGETHNLPQQLSFSWIQDDKDKEAVSSTLGSFDYGNLQKRNYYVAYAAIDLMNIAYSKLDRANAVYMIHSS